MTPESYFWMDGLLASEIVEISSDPAVLDGPGFWAVVVTFEGVWTCVRFGKVEKSSPPIAEWQGISTPWNSSLSKPEYISYVNRIQELIALGSVYQVNACRVLTTISTSSLAGLFTEIFHKHRSPYKSFLRIPGLEIASASPELFLRRELKGANTFLTTSPIKGTSTSNKFGDKDQAENLMIVDLMRNDLGRISKPGSVQVPHLFRVEEHPGLFQLVSDVTGELRGNTSWTEIGEALLPAGSISGAPKSSALEVIRNEESAPRGPYCGVIGWVSGGEALLSVGIRLFWKEKEDLVNFGTGAGITWSSDAIQEWEETELKARRLMQLANKEGNN